LAYFVIRSCDSLREDCTWNWSFSRTATKSWTAGKLNKSNEVSKGIRGVKPCMTWKGAHYTASW